MASLAGSGTVSLGSNTLDITQAQGSFDGGITGAGGLTLASGNQVLGGANSFLGGTTVQGGTLGLANGSGLASGLVVQSGGSVQVGSASVAGSVSNGGMLSIGSTAAPNAALSVGGSYTQGANGVLSLAISPSSNSQLVVNGPSLTLGGTLRVSAAPGNYLKTTYVLVQAPATTVLNGRFSQLQLTGLGSQYAYQLTYLSDPQVLLSLYQANSFQQNATTANAGGPAGALDTAIASATGSWYDRLNALYTLPQAQLSQALDRMDGQLYAQAGGWLLHDLSWSWGQAFSRMNLAQQIDPQPERDVFLLTGGQRGHTIGDGNADATHTQASTMTLGVQGRRAGWDLGVMGGSLHDGATRDWAADSESASLWRVGGFAGRRMGPVRLGAVFGYAQGPVQTGGASRTARAWTLQARVGRAVVLPRQGLSLMPLLGLDLQHLSLPAARESDSQLGLQVPSQSEYSSSMLAAVRADRVWERGTRSWIFSTALGLRHEFRLPSSGLTLEFNGVPGVPFTTQAVAVDRNVLQGSLGVQLRNGKQMTLSLSYQGEYGHSTRANALSLRASWAF